MGRVIGFMYGLIAYAAFFVTIFYASFLIDHFDLFGLRLHGSPHA